jgi:hypothetical protein
MNYGSRPLKYIVTRTVGIDEPGNYAHREVLKGEVFRRYTGNTFGYDPLPGGIHLVEEDFKQTVYFEFPLEALKVYTGQETAVLPLGAPTEELPKVSD